MIVQETIVRCPYCKSTEVTKNGKTNTKQKTQKYQCRAEGCPKKFFTANPKVVLPEAQKRMYADLYMNDKTKSLRQMSQFLGVSHQSIRNWVILYHGKEKLAERLKMAQKD